MSSAAETDARGIPAQRIAWAAFLLPFCAVHACFLIAVAQGHIPLCNPYWDGCTSISRAGRSGDAIYLFRGLMLPFAALLLTYWWLAAGWLRSRRADTTGRIAVLQGLGSVGAGFLALYVSTLGEAGELANWMRRTGINLFFGLTVLALMLMTSLLQAPCRASVRACRSRLRALCGGMLLLGLASLPLQHFVDDRPALLNALEWQISLLLILALLCVAPAWRQDNLRLQIRAEPGAGSTPAA